MRRRGMFFYFVVIVLFCGASLTSCSADNTVSTDGKYFTDATMRIDYYHIADRTSEIITLDKVYKQGIWAGNPGSYIDPFNNGMYYVKVYDEADGTLIYSKGFNSYCGEYVTTAEAKKGIKRTYHETVLIPFPLKKITFTLEKRGRTNKLETMFSQVIDPTSRNIIKESLSGGVTVIQHFKNGDPHKKVDLAIIAEGYTKVEEAKFRKDLKENIDRLFRHEPYKSHKNSFNVYGVFKPSLESGPDEPRKGIFKTTALGATFNALDLTHYMLTEENRQLRDIAAHVPYDTLVILVNSGRYGGGGLYNFYCIYTSDNPWKRYLMVHEFGHSFAGLADEYYHSAVPYESFFAPGIEPFEPNITALGDPQKLKWRDLVTPGTPLPTPWGKKGYDEMISRNQHKYLKANDDKYKDMVGAFEGAGYKSEGLYRPMFNCIMFSRHDSYCKVCKHAVTRMIKYYTGEE